MLLEFPVLSDDEIERINLLEPGIYEFEVVKSEGEYSKSSGNPQIRLDLRILDANNREYLLIDYLVNTERMHYKIKHFCEATGVPYSGKLSDKACENRKGKAEIIIIPKKPDGKGGHYRAKNSVKDYVKLDGDISKEAFTLSVPPKMPADEFINDALPF